MSVFCSFIVTLTKYIPLDKFGEKWELHTSKRPQTHCKILQWIIYAWGCLVVGGPGTLAKIDGITCLPLLQGSNIIGSFNRIMTIIYFQMWGHKINVLHSPSQSQECQGLNSHETLLSERKRYVHVRKPKNIKKSLTEGVLQDILHVSPALYIIRKAQFCYPLWEKL